MYIIYIEDNKTITNLTPKREKNMACHPHTLPTVLIAGF